MKKIMRSYLNTLVEYSRVNAPLLEDANALDYALIMLPNIATQVIIEANTFIETVNTHSVSNWLPLVVDVLENHPELVIDSVSGGMFKGTNGVSIEHKTDKDITYPYNWFLEYGEEVANMYAETHEEYEISMYTPPVVITDKHATVAEMLGFKLKHGLSNNAIDTILTKEQIIELNEAIEKGEIVINNRNMQYVVTYGKTTLVYEFNGTTVSALKSITKCNGTVCGDEYSNKDFIELLGELDIEVYHLFTDSYGVDYTHSAQFEYYGKIIYDKIMDK